MINLEFKSIPSIGVSEVFRGIHSMQVIFYCVRGNNKFFVITETISIL